MKESRKTIKKNTHPQSAPKTLITSLRFFSLPALSIIYPSKLTEHTKGGRKGNIPETLKRSGIK